MKQTLSVSVQTLTAGVDSSFGAPKIGPVSDPVFA